jgi:hypothetical protein
MVSIASRSPLLAIIIIVSILTRSFIPCLIVKQEIYRHKNEIEN